VRSFCVPADETDPEAPVDPVPEGDIRDGFDMANDGERELWADRTVDFWYWEMAELDFTKYEPGNLYTSILKRYYEDKLLMGGAMYDAKYVGRTDYVLGTPLWGVTEEIRAALKVDADRGGLFRLRNVKLREDVNVYFDLDMLAGTLPYEYSYDMLRAWEAQEGAEVCCWDGGADPHQGVAPHLSGVGRLVVYSTTASGDMAGAVAVAEG
jgi:hypothetical protein